MCDVNMCAYGMCEHCFWLDDGEDENGYPYPPNPYCEAAEKFIQEDGQVCLAPDKKRSRYEDRIVLPPVSKEPRKGRHVDAP